LIRISVKYLASFSAITGRKEETLTVPEDTTLKGFLLEIVEKYGPAIKKELFVSQTTDIKPRILVLVNGRSVSQLPDKLDAVLSSGDSVILTLPMSGG